METTSVRLRRKILRSMILIRAFEDRLTALAREGGRLAGIQILSVGQEAGAAAVLALRDEDVLVSNHRNHAHLLARGTDPEALMAEIMGKATGVNRGKSGTLHLIVPEVNALMTSTVVGAGPPMAVGAGFAQQYREEASITAVFFGDGAAAEGSVHEAMNLAGVWKLPLFFVCENNRWAGAQRLEVHLAGGSVAARAVSYGMPAETVDGNDADAVYETAARLVEGIRTGGGPALLELQTYRMHGHSEADPQLYVDPDELEAWALRDPIQRYVARLVEEEVLSASDVDTLRREATRTVEQAVAFAERSPEPLPEGALEDVWSRPLRRAREPQEGRRPRGTPRAPEALSVPRPPSTPGGAGRRLVGGQAVNEALAVAMELDEDVFLAGEGVGVSIHPNPMGPIHGLLQRFGSRRIRDTPVSEAAIAGLGVGAATLGLKPVVEVMFFPFVTLASDMLVNHAAKLHFLSGGRTSVPLTVRVKAGIGFQSGCQHSHNLEAWLAHAPGLKVVWGSNPADMKGLLLSAIFDPDPVVVVEDLGLYRVEGHVPEGDVRVPLGEASVARAGNDVTVAAYGAAVSTALQAADALEQEGVSVEVLDLRSLVPLDRDAVFASVTRTGRFVMLHDATRFCGFGAEVAAMVAEEAFGELKAPVRRVAAPDAPVPFAVSQERFHKPGPERVVAAVRSLL
ncbi:MAG: dehydrogenase E1 component subunit alpha/beta [Gemmatimonadetes bacterium]|nr:dehydrogenase E1 component subunit alpha/beta [Gemmatimonadota bacterium]